MSEKDLGPGTWDYELRKHFEYFTAACWRCFNAAVEEMREKGHQNKVTKEAWRDFVIYDMQRRHDEEVKNEGSKESSKTS